MDEGVSLKLAKMVNAIQMQAIEAIARAEVPKLTPVAIADRILAMLKDEGVLKEDGK